jgi:hypothetical protein
MDRARGAGAELVEGDGGAFGGGEVEARGG